MDYFQDLKGTYYKDNDTILFLGGAAGILKTFPDGFVQTVCTSPPYFGLRNYHTKGQIGLEDTLNEYLDRLLLVTAELRRVLKNTGTVWWNHGDSYGGSLQGYGTTKRNIASGFQDVRDGYYGSGSAKKTPLAHMTPKCLTLQNFRFLQRMIDEQEWILRNILIWLKPDAQPSSVKDRFSVDYEPVFLLAKSRKYYFKQLFEPLKASTEKRLRCAFNVNKGDVASSVKTSGLKKFQERYLKGQVKGRNMRCVWSVPTSSLHYPHYAIFPERLIEPMIRAGSAPGDIVLDPFTGSGTTGVVAKKLGRQFVGIDINRTYLEIAKKRIKNATNSSKV